MSWRMRSYLRTKGYVPSVRCDKETNRTEANDHSTIPFGVTTTASTLQSARTGRKKSSLKPTSKDVMEDAELSTNKRICAFSPVRQRNEQNGGHWPFYSTHWCHDDK